MGIHHSRINRVVTAGKREDHEKMDLMGKTN